MNLTKERKALQLIKDLVETNRREQLDSEAVEMFVEAARRILGVRS